MIRSRNEIAAMATSAARGAGIVLGHAEDFGPVVAHMAAHNPSGLSCLAAVLECPSRPIAMRSDGDGLLIAKAQVIFAAPIAIDMIKSGVKRVQLSDLDAPALLAAYCEAAGGIVCSQNGDLYEVSPLVVSAPPNAVQATEFPDEIWGILSGFAAQTYVPASEASRLSGAGAGLHDND